MVGPRAGCRRGPRLDRGRHDRSLLSRSAVRDGASVHFLRRGIRRPPRLRGGVRGPDPPLDPGDPSGARAERRGAPARGLASLAPPPSLARRDVRRGRLRQPSRLELRPRRKFTSALRAEARRHPLLRQGARVLLRAASGAGDEHANEGADEEGHRRARHPLAQQHVARTLWLAHAEAAGPAADACAGLLPSGRARARSVLRQRHVARRRGRVELAASRLARIAPPLAAAG
jgi:hypothetical protein